MKVLKKVLKVLLIIVLVIVVLAAVLDAAWIFVPQIQASKKLADIKDYGHEGYQIEIPEGKTVIALGEASHGNVEFQELKLSVLKHLVETTGVRSFSLEADYAEGIIVNEYIHGVGDIKDAREAVKMLTYGIYQTQQMVDLVQWMHDYNQGADEADKLSFYGFDIRCPEIDAKVIADYCDKNGITPNSGSTALLKEFAEKESAIDDSKKDAFYADINGIRDNLDTSDAEAHSIAISCECVIKAKEHSELDPTDYIASSNERDKAMAENVSKIAALEKELGHDMIFITGHDGHVSTHPLFYTPMGINIKNEFADGYYIIGTDYFKTTCNIVNSKGRGNYNFCSADPMAYQAKQFNGMYCIRFQDVLDGENKGATYELIQKPMNAGSLGESYTPVMSFVPITNRVKNVMPEGYDAMIYVYKATPTKILPRD
ncbi:MAG: erythromycin esterase family protein [Butyrivibrio sp.]|nr:erythromycin esterase family protein [Butyrivibrio sp.]